MFKLVASFKALSQALWILTGILLKPSMVTPGAESKDRATPEQVASYTLKLLRSRVPPAVPGIMASFSLFSCLT